LNSKSQSRKDNDEKLEEDNVEKIRGTGLTSTMATLTQRVKTYPHLDFIIVAGDNYYPQKDNSKDKTKDKTKTKDKPKSDINPLTFSMIYKKSKYFIFYKIFETIYGVVYHIIYTNYRIY
jgi:hypothetical protein